MPQIEPGPEVAPAAPPPPPTAAAKPAAPGLRPREVALVLALLAALVWGAWVTKTVTGLKSAGQPFVKVQLQGVIGEYIRAQSRTGTPPERVSAETTAFMKALDDTVKTLSAGGKVVLVNEAVVGGDVPDVTADVRRAVYAKVPMPRIAAANDVEAKMQAYLSQTGGGGGTGD